MCISAGWATTISEGRMSVVVLVGQLLPFVSEGLANVVEPVKAGSLGYP